MKVLHIISIGGYGGAEKLLLQLLPALNKRVTVECAIFYQDVESRAALDIGAQLQVLGIHVYFVPYSKWYAKSVVRSLKGIIEESKCTVLHSHLKRADAWVAYLKKKGHTRIPAVSTMHGYNDEYENKFGLTVRKDLYYSPYYYIAKYIYKYFDGFVLISNVVERFFRESRLIKAQKKSVIYHGYDSALIRYGITTENNDGVWKIAVPGRLIRRKGHRFLVEAVNKLLGKYKITIHIYGQGSEEAELRRQVVTLGMEEIVFFHGYVDNPVEALARMDMVVVPSLGEGFGLVFLDGFAAGRPVIGFDLPAANEIIRHGQNGLLAKGASVEDLVSKIEMLIKDDQLRKDVTENARRDLHERFSIDGMAEKYVSFYNEVGK